MAEQPDQFSATACTRLERGLHIPAIRYIETLHLRGKLLETFITEAFASADVLICPTPSIPTPPRSDVKPASQAVYRTVSTITQLICPF